MYKMITAEGNTRLEQMLQMQPNLKYKHHTLWNNMNQVHKLIYEWAKTKINLGNAEEWNAAAANRLFQEPFADTNLWIDSSDFPVQNPHEDGWRSHKLDHKFDIKVQFVVDAKERVRYINGPISPKQFDGNFLESHVDEFREKFKGAKIIGDNHYRKGVELFKPYKDPVFYCNEMETAKDKKIAQEENLPTRSRGKKRKIEVDFTQVPAEDRHRCVKKLKENQILSHTRGLIEGVFGNIKRKFKMVSTRIIHQDPQLLYQHIVIASAINNIIIDLNNNF
jgi:hypothetical protein